MARGYLSQRPPPPGFLAQVCRTVLRLTPSQLALLPTETQFQVLRVAFDEEINMAYWNQVSLTHPPAPPELSPP